MDSAGMRGICAKLPLAEAALEVFRFVGDEARLQAIFLQVSREHLRRQDSIPLPC